MALENQRSTPSSSPDSAVILGALGILAYAASMMTHEALGHGGDCVASGGHNTMLTGWGESCSIAPHGIEAAGPGMQFAGGLLAWWILRQLPVRAARLRYCVWLYMVFSLFISASYVAFSGVTGLGDGAAIIAALKAQVFWRGVLVLLGGAVYFLSMVATAFEFKRFVGARDGSRSLRRLVWIPYATAGVFACCAAALNRTMATGSLSSMGHRTALVWAVSSSFASGMGMLWLPDMRQMFRLKARTPVVYLRWSTGWAVAAGVVVAIFLLWIGPGLR